MGSSGVVDADGSFGTMDTSAVLMSSGGGASVLSMMILTNESVGWKGGDGCLLRLATITSLHFLYYLFEYISSRWKYDIISSMKQVMRRVRHIGRTLFDYRILVALSGIVLSIIAHELFHIFVHWGHITDITLFPNHAAIVEITSITEADYNVLFEEVIAYGITLIVLLLTAIMLARIHDARDTRSFTQTVLPRTSTLHELSKRELFELASRINLL